MKINPVNGICKYEHKKKKIIVIENRKWINEQMYVGKMNIEI